MRHLRSLLQPARAWPVALVVVVSGALAGEAVAAVSLSPNPPVVDKEATVTVTGTVTHWAGSDPNSVGQTAVFARVGPAEHPCSNADAIAGPTPVIDLAHPLLAADAFTADGPFSFTSQVVFPVAGLTRICEDVTSNDAQSNQVITTTEALDVKVSEAPPAPVVVPPSGILPLTVQAPTAGTFTATATFTVGGKGKKAGARAGIARTLTYGTATVTAPAPGPVALTIPPTPAALRALRHKRNIAVSVHLAFRSTARLGNTTSTKDLKLKVHRRKH